MTAVLDEPTWRARSAAHERRVDALLADHKARRRVRVTHPVEDFLFTYYSLRPAQLRRWHPGAAVELRGAVADQLGWEYERTAAGAVVNPAAVRSRRGESITWIRELLAATAARSAHLGCFGLHEWAMVYRLDQSEVRHTAWPLRLPPEEVASLVEARGIRCSHFDAFRFFAGPARPLNVIQPTRDTQHAHEQPGCLHANMDLYKWAYKLLPLVDSETVVDCFELARDIRALDMRASPYDLADLGYPPVRIETPEGRAEYAAAQREFAARAAPLRQRLIAAAAA
jgi:hypothetical protein